MAALRLGKSAVGAVFIGSTIAGADALENTPCIMQPVRTLLKSYSCCWISAQRKMFSTWREKCLRT
jgi:hypothetical protein